MGAAISTAIGSERRSRVSGYKILKGVFNNVTPNLPQQIVILGEANDANQAGLPLLNGAPLAQEITSAAQAAQIYGYGSPIHQIMRILRPISGNGVGGIPTTVMAQLAAAGASATINAWSISGVATKNQTHYFNINGRESLDFNSYAVNIVTGDKGDTIAQKYADAVNAILGSPGIATQSAVAGTFETASVLFSATPLSAGQTVTLAGLTYTSTGATTQAQLAAAFANLANGATTGAGTGTGTYSGALTGYATGAVITSTTVVFTATTTGNQPNLTQSGTGAAATITITAGTNPVGIVTLTTKWKGLTSASLSTLIDINGDGAGLTYALTTQTAGAGSPDISGALAQFEDNWYTTVINSYGAAQFATLEEFNGIPDPETPTGRYDGIVFKPFMAFFGSLLSDVDALRAITNADARKAQVTNVLCPAPGSLGFPWEAAANMVALFGPIMQNTPYLDVNAQSYPDMPIPASNNIGDMSDYNNRDLLLKSGCSTVILANGAYQVQDLVTTYHPDGEDPLEYNYARNLNLDWNIKDGYSILEGLYVKDHVIIADDQITTVSNAVKPKEWASVLYDFFDSLAENALITDAAFSKASLQVQIDPTNPNRFNTIFSYKRTGIARIESTDVSAGF